MQATSTNSIVLRSTGQNARCITGKRTTNAFSALEPFANGFLRHPVLPLYQYNEDVLPPQEISEKQFISSLNAFSKKQGFPCDGFIDRPYPYNILLCFDQLTTAMKYSKPDSDLLIVRSGDNRIALAETECFCNNNTLYYIPVYPLYKSLKARPKCRGLQIILSVFSYFCHVVGIPYHRDEGTYLYWQYEMIKDWIKSDPDSYDGQTYRQKLAEIARAARIGNKIAKMIYQPCQLECFEKRVTEFNPKTDWDRQVWKIGKRALLLYRQYPNSTLFDNVSDREFDYDYISIGDYVSFIHDFQGSLYEDIFQTVNEDFGNRSEIQEPSSVYLYGIDGESRNDIGFEQRLFPLIDDLITLLMEL